MLGEHFPEIMRRAAALEGQAFAELWRDAHPPLLRYLRVAAPDHAEDLASEVWLDVARRIGEFRGGEPDFRGWLFTLARRKLIDRIRYDARHPESPVGETDALDLPAVDDTVAAALEGIATDAALALIATLPKEQAEIVMLRVVAGLDAKQVAQIVNKSPGAVRIAAHRALRTLAGRLTDPALIAARHAAQGGTATSGPVPRHASNGHSPNTQPPNGNDPNRHAAGDRTGAILDYQRASHRAAAPRSTGGVTLCGDMSFLCL